MLMWVMSDRAIPRSYATMEGFGVHTFRLVAADGSTSLVKWHWKPVAGIHSLVWEESQKLGGIDPDFHRRDLHARIASGNFPQWELGVQVMPDTEDQTFEGIDLLDPTKIVPEELCPVRIVGTLTLDRNPANFFAETEQVAFHPGHLVPGIGFVDDPLLHARLFSYLDTQLTRLGGPNFAQIPINRPLAPVNDNNRDGFMQQAVHEGVAPYTPNSLGGGCPFARAGDGRLHPRAARGRRTEGEAAPGELRRPLQPGDAVLPVADRRRAGPHRRRVQLRARQVRQPRHPRAHGRATSREVDADLAEQVAAHLGIDAPAGAPVEPEVLVARALDGSTGEPGPVDGRIVAVLVDDTTPTAGW